MEHRISASDGQFIDLLERGELSPDQFDHRAHVRAAYVYLVRADADTATVRMREALLGFLQRHRLPTSKYHATITAAWILAVRHFMEQSAPSASADEFIAGNPELLDSRIMLTHYSAELLFSPEARAEFVEPDESPIPRYE